MTASRYLINRLEAALRRAARSAPPEGAAEGEWWSTQFERIDFPGDYFIRSGPVVWVPSWMVKELAQASLFKLPFKLPEN